MFEAGVRNKETTEEKCGHVGFHAGNGNHVKLLDLGSKYISSGSSVGDGFSKILF